MKHFYCPSCGKIYSSKVDGELQSIDNKMVIKTVCYYNCDCGNKAVEIDQGLVVIIQNINKSKFKTKFCCEGHIRMHDNGSLEYENAYIVFDDSVTMEMFNDVIGKYPLPNGWNIELDDTSNNVCIKYTNIDDDFGKLSDIEFEIKKKFYLMELSRWVTNALSEESDIIE